MRRLLLPVLVVALLGAPAVSYAAIHDCPEAVQAVRGEWVTEQAVGAALDAAAAARAVPVQVLRAIAYVESGWRQFDDYHAPYASPWPGCRVGVLGVDVAGYAPEDQVRLASDYAYNVDEGARLLRAEWEASQTAPPPGGAPDDPDVIENWYHAICGYGRCGTDPAYPDRVAGVVADPFRYADATSLLRPYRFTRPRDAWPGYAFPGAFQARYAPVREFVFYDPETGVVTHTAAAPTHSLADTPAPVVAYPANTTGPDGPRVSCWQCGRWRLADGAGATGRAHLAETVTGQDRSYVRWEPPRDGVHRVWAYVPALPGVTLGVATYRVGNNVVYEVDQEAAKGTWVPLGDHLMYQESGPWLYDAADVAGQPIVADAVRYARVPKLAVSTPSPDVGYGARIAVNAYLHHSGGGAPGRTIRFYRRPLGATTWRYYAAATTDAKGRATIFPTATANVEYTAKFTAPDAGWISVSGGKATIKVRSVLTASVSRTEGPRGTPVTLTVRVRPAHAGYRLPLYRNVGYEAYEHIATATLSSTGYARFTVRRATSGSYRYYAKLPGHADHSTGWSNEVWTRWT